MRSFLFILLIFIGGFTAHSQSAPFEISLNPVNINGLGGVQSYAYGQQDGKWLIIGGRLDGLHRRQPFASFDLPGHNDQLIVVDPAAKQFWTASLATLSVSLQEQLKSTNMAFYQEKNTLYIMGGYGYSATADDHTTYPYLTAVDVAGVIDAIMEDKPFSSFFRQIEVEKCAVTGGQLRKIYADYYLIGGQRFEGRYNPMGPDHGPGFVQDYTNAIRKFSINDDGVNLNINLEKEWIDSAQLHRRDYNVVEAILPNGQEGAVAFSGVFQVDVDVPFLNAVQIDSSGYTVIPNFSQYYNHYHCATVPLYSASEQTMHNLFFGGIAQYYDLNGLLVQDDEVPFVKTIARVSQTADGKMAEYKLPVEMPALLGAGSEFIVSPSIAEYPNGVIKLDELSADSTLLGHIYGGISSTAPNIFFINEGDLSEASTQLLEVWLHHGPSSAINQLNAQSTGTLQLQILPNPNEGDFAIRFNITKSTNVHFYIQDSQGEAIYDMKLNDVQAGPNTYTIALNKLGKAGVYIVRLDAGYEKAIQKVVINP
jgi:hypothetical protein